MAVAKGSPSGAAETTTRRRGRSVLDVVILAGLLAVVVNDVVAQLLEGRIIPPVLVFSTIYLILAGVVATGWRWAMLLPLIIVPLVVAAEFATGFPAYALTHPSEHLPFTNLAIKYPLLAIVVVASSVKLVQTLRRETPHAPRWLTPALSALAGLVLGALLVGATAQFSGAGSSATAKAGTETVHLVGATFSPDIIALHAGDTLAVVDDAPIPHILTNGTWSASNQPVPGVEPGAPVVNNVHLNNNTVILGPFPTPGTYHIYCTVHPGMNLTIVVP